MLCSLVFPVLLALIPFASAQFPSNCARNYTVLAGDTCNSISAANNVSTYQLAFVNVNSINSECTNLFVGETICLGQKGQDCNITHVDVSGDTCDMIDNTAGISLDILLHNNPNVFSDCSNIAPGEVLCTSSVLFNYTH